MQTIFFYWKKNVYVLNEKLLSFDPINICFKSKLIPLRDI